MEATLTTPSGVEWNLLGSSLSTPVAATEGALMNLVASPARSDLTLPGGSGVLPGRTRWEPISENVTFYLNNMNGTRDLEDVWAEFYAAWSLWSPTAQPCVLKVKARPHAMSASLKLWLNDALPGPRVVPNRREALSVEASLFSPDGLFYERPSGGQGTVEVINTGVAIVYPTITSWGAGGTVTNPSGATWFLPAGDVTVEMNPRKLMAATFPEGVPPGEAGTWVLPAEAMLSYSLAVANPWG